MSLREAHNRATKQSHEQQTFAQDNIYVRLLRFFQKLAMTDHILWISNYTPKPTT